MTNKKILFGILIIVLSFGIILIGCDNGTGASWPENINGTKWTKEDFGTLEFKTDNTFYFDFIDEACKLVSAVENGKIVIKYKGENETICTSYSISGDTLTFTNPSRKILDEEVTWTKED